MKPLEPPYESLEQLREDWAVTAYEKEFIAACPDPGGVKDILTPEEAKRSLLANGHGNENYLHFINNRILSHQLRAEIITVVTDVPRVGWLVERTIREIDVLDGAEEPIFAFEFRPGMITRALQKKFDEIAGHVE
jgi:hypothetical protein